MKKPMTEEEFENTLCFKKNNVEENEYKMHQIIYDLNIINVPKIYKYDKQNKTMIMEKINNMNISDAYGEDAINVPKNIFKLMQEIIKKLYYSGIEYPDITGYNFILYKKKMYLIDFEHCNFFTNETMEKIDPFIVKFIKGACEWNPKYK
jgi:tRNA A-37 threonylcarbamoyl transferase component Bud32